MTTELQALLVQNNRPLLLRDSLQSKMGENEGFLLTIDTAINFARAGGAGLAQITLEISGVRTPCLEEDLRSMKEYLNSYLPSIQVKGENLGYEYTEKDGHHLLTIFSR